MTGNLKRLRPYDQPPKPRTPFLPEGTDAVARTSLTFGALWLMTAAGIAVLGVGQLLFAELVIKIEIPFGGLEVTFSPPAVAAGFWHTLVWGALTNLALGAIFFITPRLTGHPVVSEKLAVLGVSIWNVAFAAGLVALYMPKLAGSGTLTGFPMPVEAFLLLGLLLVNDAFWRSVWSHRAAFPSLPWFGVGMLALTGLWVAGLIIGIIGMSEPTASLVDAFFVRAVGIFWVLTVPIGVLHYLVPRLTGTPLYSRSLATVALGTWLVFGLGALTGVLSDPSVPPAVISFGHVATMLLLVPTIGVVANLWLTLRDRWTLVLSPGPVAMALAALVFLSAAALLAAVGSLHDVSLNLAGTEWWVGVYAFALGGVAAISLLAVADHAWPRMLRRAKSSGFLAYGVLWFSFGGTALAGLALLAAGVVHADLIASGATADETAAGLLYFHLVAGAGVSLVGAAAMVHGVMAYTLAAHGRPVAVAAPGGVAAVAAGH